MREAFVTRYSNQFSIPSEIEIKQEISARFARSNDSKTQKATIDWEICQMKLMSPIELENQK